MKVPHDPLDGLTMRRTRQRLKARAQADHELDADLITVRYNRDLIMLQYSF
jgi:hypothetical protein